MNVCIMNSCSNVIARPQTKGRPRIICLECDERCSHLHSHPNTSVWFNSWISSIKHRSKFEVDITSFDIAAVMPYDLKCPIFKWDFKSNTTGGACKTSPTIDRINPELGYLPNNIQIISGLANKMKQDATQEELLMFADYIKGQYAS